MPWVKHQKKNSTGLQVTPFDKSGMLDIFGPRSVSSIVFFAGLVLPFKVRAIERNHEIFLFISEVLALMFSGFLHLPGEQTGWSWRILTETLTPPPLNITNVQGIPIGIVQIVLPDGVIMYVWFRQIERAAYILGEKIPGIRPKVIFQ